MAPVLTWSNSLDTKCSMKPLFPKCFRPFSPVPLALRQWLHPTTWHCPAFDSFGHVAGGDLWRPMCAVAWSMLRPRWPKRWRSRAACSRTKVCRCPNWSAIRPRKRSPSGPCNCSNASVDHRRCRVWGHWAPVSVNSADPCVSMYSNRYSVASMTVVDMVHIDIAHYPFQPFLCFVVFFNL